MYLDYVLLWPDDGCLQWYTIVNDMRTDRVNTFCTPRLCSAGA